MAHPGPWKLAEQGENEVWGALLTATAKEQFEASPNGRSEPVPLKATMP